jgi:DNA-binding CsgD family transcriptional regulator
MNRNGETTHTAALRRTAEKKVASQPADSASFSPDWDAKRLWHELHIHQIELEMQHSELLAAQNSLDLLLEQLTHLYDFAPMGYLTLSRCGTILKCNFAAARFLGLARSEISGQFFTRFVAAADRPPLALFLEQVFTGPFLRETCSLRLLQAGGGTLPAEIEAQADETGVECLLAIVDPVRGAHAAEAPRHPTRFQPEAAALLPGKAAGWPPSILSPRERDTLKFVVEGMTNAAIAERMNISTKSVETYRSRLMLKLEIKNVPDLVKYALLHGVISL